MIEIQQLGRATFKFRMISGLFPAITIGQVRRFDYNVYGCTTPVALFETILKERVELGQPNFLFIDKDIDIYDDDGTLLICLTAIDTMPKVEESSAITVADYEGRYWLIALKNPQQNPYQEKPLFDGTGLKMYKRYMKGSVHNYHPHRYPIAARLHLNPFIRPYLTRERNFENQVGMRCFNFWELVDKLKAAGLKKHRHLEIDAMVALYRTKLRQDINFVLLSTMYGSDDPKGMVSLRLKTNFNI